SESNKDIDRDDTQSKTYLWQGDLKYELVNLFTLKQQCGQQTKKSNVSVPFMFIKITFIKIMLRDIKKLAKDPEENDALAKMLEKLDSYYKFGALKNKKECAFLTEGNKFLIIYPIGLLQKIHAFLMTISHISIEDVKNSTIIQIYVNKYLEANLSGQENQLAYFNNICCIKFHIKIQ
ncbi:hypothetical protein ACJX0J_015954, partial [Zea mays]